MRRIWAAGVSPALSEDGISGDTAGRKRLLIRSVDSDPVPFCWASVVIRLDRDGGFAELLALGPDSENNIART